MTDIELSAKKDLSNYAHMIECIKSCQSRALEIRDRAVGVRTACGIGVSGGVTIPAGQMCLETLEQVAKRMDEQTERYGQKTMQALDVLFSIENVLYVRILMMRYIDWVTGSGRQPTWDRMAWELHYDISYIKYLHRKALQAFHEQKTRLFPTLDLV